MGAVLEKSRIAEELLDTMGRLFGQLRGGLGISVVWSARCWRPRPASSARRWLRWE
jgi:TRAP-type mannitol/chloroaromatic compound transport system permease large subunit